MPALPYAIKIFMPGGDPDGLRTIEKSNWSGCGFCLSCCSPHYSSPSSSFWT